MISAFRVKIAVTIRTDRSTSEIFRNRQLMSTNSAQYRVCFVFIQIPNLRRMINASGVAFKTRKPIAAAFKFNRNHIHVAMIMRTPGLRVNVNAVNCVGVNQIHLKID